MHGTSGTDRAEWSYAKIAMATLGLGRTGDALERLEKFDSAAETFCQHLFGKGCAQRACRLLPSPLPSAPCSPSDYAVPLFVCAGAGWPPRICARTPTCTSTSRTGSGSRSQARSASARIRTAPALRTAESSRAPAVRVLAHLARLVGSRHEIVERHLARADDGDRKHGTICSAVEKRVIRCFIR